MAPQVIAFMASPESVAVTTEYPGAVVDFNARTITARFPAGVTTLTVIATSADGTNATASVLVTVNDLPPVIGAAPTAVSGTVEPSAAATGKARVTFAAPTVTDAIDGTITSVCTPASNDEFPVGNTVRS